MSTDNKIWLFIFGHKVGSWFTISPNWFSHKLAPACIVVNGRFMCRGWGGREINVTAIWRWPSLEVEVRWGLLSIMWQHNIDTLEYNHYERWLSMIFPSLQYFRSCQQFITPTKIFAFRLQSQHMICLLMYDEIHVFVKYIFFVMKRLKLRMTSFSAHQSSVMTKLV